MSFASLPTRSCCKYCSSLARSSVSASSLRGEVGDSRLAGRMVEVTFPASIRPWVGQEMRG
jgi:hypothetical protein